MCSIRTRAVNKCLIWVWMQIIRYSFLMRLMNFRVPNMLFSSRCSKLCQYDFIVPYNKLLSFLMVSIITRTHIITLHSNVCTVILSTSSTTWGIMSWATIKLWSFTTQSVLECLTFFTVFPWNFEYKMNKHSYNVLLLTILLLIKYP